MAGDSGARTWTAPARAVSAAAGAERAVRVHEVGPRDGLQAEDAPLSAQLKIDFCRRLLAAGVRSLEAASFVHPGRVPQMADAEEVLAGLAGQAGAELVSLVPNPRGLERALTAGAASVAVFASATEAFARANLGTDRDASIATAGRVARDAVAAGSAVRGYLSMCFGDPWEGAVDPDAVVRAAEALRAAGCQTVVISDTIGVAHAGQVEDILGRLHGAGFAPDSLALHLHDTYGQALSCVDVALRAGIRQFDSSAGGLGRCPFAPGATGNLATEDLLWMLHGMGFETGIDLRALAAATDAVDRALGRSTTSAVKRALDRA
ncbi:hydroxymethylglutaryl-CoA lyase [Brevibacterium sp. 5221]|uniref:Hydroxymethylglutaryl-CoA lyase n=1 Tax=Brevibacterium rongguiense TaxID=2695267 RepID=A0A6N9HAV4_9MICO|nr:MULTISPECIES: hydroxymethylglutaryl-CoA lyase [Brevibacterium]MYM20692.1 hydroxymethylglutaryl-CoA lyase [Brevibacterium rongguiense]WAL39537.1 hydroxymethylglutaryl-CoA lyase [Brevibacterium sp. BRM-1]